MMRKNQRGVGMVEVLVSLVILSIAVLGYAVLQIRALEASLEASNNIQAMNIARDLAERMRMNREGISEYKPLKSDAEVEDCATDFCSPLALAQFDYSNVQQRAAQLGMSINVLACPESVLSRMCVYVAWDETRPVDGQEKDTCTNGVAYQPNAKCVIMEALNDL